MIIGINQPYYLPYIGLFSRMYLCELFIINGCSKLNLVRANHRRVRIINENTTKNATLFLTQRISKIYEKTPFNRIPLTQEFWERQQLHHKTIYYTYKRYRHFELLQNTMELIVDRNVNNLGEYNFRIIQSLARILKLNDRLVYLNNNISNIELPEIETNTDFVNSSNVQNWKICKLFGASEMIAGQNGPLWVNESFFDNHGINISYQKVYFPEYTQRFNKDKFLPGLSVIDAIANIGIDTIELIRNSAYKLTREDLVREVQLTGR